jgi:hypothetical protein
MTHTRILNVVTVMLLVHMGTAWRVEAQERENLKGLSGIAVHAGAIGNATASVTQIESVLRQRLQAAGITIVTAQAPRPYGTQGHLWVDLLVLPSATGANSYFVQTRLRMYGSVTLAGGNDRAEAITWETERVTIVPVTDVDARFREDLNFLIDDFSTAYRSANPR